MNPRAHYPAGVPSWIDLTQPDVQAASAFYGGLFGWTFEDRMPADGPYHYLIARLDGMVVGAHQRPTTRPSPTSAPGRCTSPWTMPTPAPSRYAAAGRVLVEPTISAPRPADHRGVRQARPRAPPALAGPGPHRRRARERPRGRGTSAT